MTSQPGEVDWVPLQFRRWIAGTAELTGDAELAYWRLCLRCYDRQSPVVDMSEARLAHWCKLPPDRMREALVELVDTGKIERVEAGLFIPSIEAHLSAAILKMSARRRGAEISRRRMDLKRLNKTPEEIDAIIKAEFESGTAVDTPDACVDAVAQWNAFASSHGLSTVAKLTPSRRASLRKRLDECVGIGGWGAALELVGRSSFLLGAKPNATWRATFDFLLQPSSFQKLLEGQYTDRAGSVSTLRGAFEKMIDPNEVAK